MARPRLPALVRVSTSRSGGLYTRTYAEFPQEELRDYGSPGSARAIAEAFQVDIVQGLIHLVFEQLGERLPAPLSFLREFAKSMFIQWLLAARAGARSLALPAPHSADAWEQLARNVPDITTANATVLDELWRELHRQVVAILKANNLTLLEWMCLKGGDVWQRIGDLVLRLDVGGDDPGRPFVLYCHVVDGLSSAERLRLTPVYVHVLGNGRVAGIGGRIYKLLREAADSSPIVARLLASQEIFSPCHLIPRDAHAFLLSIPALEALGLSVQVPDWWKTRRAPQLAVRTRIGSQAPTPLGVETLLDVSTAYLVDERELSEAEWRQLIQKSVDGLVNVAGRWVEVNREQIDHAGQDWRTTQQMRARGGATVSEAFELLGQQRPSTAPNETITPGPWLGEALGALERQDLRRVADPGPELHCQLRPYQRQGVTWLSTVLDMGLGALLADDMGLGKTVQVIALILSLKRREVPGPHLIVAPASLLANWREEIERWTRPPLPVAVVHHDHDGSDDAVDPLIVLTSYNTLLRRPELQARSWGMIVLDEAQTIKNGLAKMTRALKRMQSRMRVCLTGTPVENSLSDLWSLMDFLNPGLLGTEAEFAAQVRDVRSAPQSVLEPLRRRIRPVILRRLKTDPGIADTLPRKVEMAVYCGLTTVQADLYLQAIAQAREQLRSARSKDRSGVILTLLTRLKQVCNHPSQYRKDGLWDVYSSAKFIRLRQLGETIAASGEKALIFTQYHELTAPLARLLAEPFAAPGLVLDGQTPVNQRQDLVAQFQNPDGPRFMVMTTKAGGTGLNLTAASQVVHFDRWWNPAAENQATDRAFRIGQIRNVFVHKFVVKGTVEQKIQLKIDSKNSLVSDLFADDEDPLHLQDLGDEEILRIVDLDRDQPREDTTA